MDHESGKKTLLPSPSLSRSPLTRKKGPDPGWTELGRAYRRGAGQGQGHRDGLGTGAGGYLGKERRGGEARRLPLARSVIQRFDVENSTGQDKVQGSPDRDGHRTGFLREWAKWAANGPEAESGEGVTGAECKRRN